MEQTAHTLNSPTGRTTSTLNPCATEWYPPGFLTPPAQQDENADCDTTPVNPHPDAAASTAFMLSELPMEILSSVVGFLGCSKDLTACILASQHMQAAVRSARVSFELTGRPRQRLSFPSQSGALSDLVDALIRYMPAMSACDLSMLPLEHTHVVRLSQGLHNLQHLDLSGCKKLQPSMTPQLLQHLASKQLQSLNLQRCFQLTDTCLTDLLEYACSSQHSSSKALQCIALSHLNLAAWPADSSKATAARVAGSSSRSTSSSGSDDDDSSNSINSDSAGATSDSDSVGDGTAISNNNSSRDAMQWHSAAARILSKLPCQLGAPLLSPMSSAALRVVVLNNCSQVPGGGLVSLAVACPQLEYLFLGGSTLATPAMAAAADGGVYVPRIVSAAAAGAAGGGGAGGGTALADTVELPGALQQLSELLQLPATLPWEVLSACCDTGSSDSNSCGQGSCCSCTCTCCSSLRQRRSSSGNSHAGDDDDRDAAERERARKRLHRCEPSAAAVAVARAHALSLAYVAALLPGLKAVEVSFMAPGVAGWLRVFLDKLQQLRQREVQQQQCVNFRGSGSSSSSGFAAAASCDQRPKVWQFSCATSVADALQSLSDTRVAHAAAAAAGGSISGAGSTAGGSEGVLLSPACLTMAVKCAANCSNRGRSTPLHMAADAGCACHIRALLSAGAAVAARDASGASPLFVACESGQTAAAAVLLEAGADSLVRNTAGETPLYIAALRGHLCVVELLLKHLKAADVDWTQRQLYGDAWTPLMAAAVANRVNVAVCLLRAAATLCCDSGYGSGATASTNCSSNSTAVTRLLTAQNKYGQNVLHIAARKCCRELLQLLLVYGAGQVAGRVADAAGDTPLDIARRHGHETTVRELLQQC